MNDTEFTLLQIIYNLPWDYLLASCHFDDHIFQEVLQIYKLYEQCGNPQQESIQHEFHQDDLK